MRVGVLEITTVGVGVLVNVGIGVFVIVGVDVCRGIVGVGVKDGTEVAVGV